jgi:prophage regulatory protein
MSDECGDKQTAHFDQLPESAFIRQSQLVGKVLPFSAATLWRKCREGRFPAPIKIPPNVTAWRVSEVRFWLKDPNSFGIDLPGTDKEVE